MLLVCTILQVDFGASDWQLAETMLAQINITACLQTFLMYLAISIRIRAEVVRVRVCLRSWKSRILIMKAPRRVPICTNFAKHQRLCPGPVRSPSSTEPALKPAWKCCYLLEVAPRCLWPWQVKHVIAQDMYFGKLEAPANSKCLRHRRHPVLGQRMSQRTILSEPMADSGIDLDSDWAGAEHINGCLCSPSQCFLHKYEHSTGMNEPILIYQSVTSLNNRS
jgi:hypothetical protein